MDEKAGDLHVFRSKNVPGMQKTFFLHHRNVFGSKTAEISSPFIHLENSWIKSRMGGVFLQFCRNSYFALKTSESLEIRPRNCGCQTTCV